MCKEQFVKKSKQHKCCYKPECKAAIKKKYNQSSLAETEMVIAKKVNEFLLMPAR